VLISVVSLRHFRPRISLDYGTGRGGHGRL